MHTALAQPVVEANDNRYGSITAAPVRADGQRFPPVAVIGLRHLTVYDQQMTKRFILNVVTGAPGAGKTLSAQRCAAIQSSYLAFDMDWLIESASALAEKDIRISPETWPPYNALWMDVIEAVVTNGMETVLFAPLAPTDLLSVPAWCSGIRWLLLDCSHDVRRRRLSDRQWEEGRIQAALVDAEELRKSGIDTIIRTDQLDQQAVADAISAWQGSSVEGRKPFRNL